MVVSGLGLGITQEEVLSEFGYHSERNWKFVSDVIAILLITQI